MGNNVVVHFSDPANSVDQAAFDEFDTGRVTEHLGSPGVVAARRYAMRKMRGTEFPARYRLATFYEVADSGDALIAQLRGPDTDPPTWTGDVATAIQQFEWLEGARPLASWNRHVLVYTVPPDGMTFEAYNAWYPEHIQQNIRATERIHDGWRYRLAGGTGPDGPLPNHCAIYALEGSADEMLVDVMAAVASGATTMLDNFRMFSSFESIPLGERLTAG